MFAVAEVGKGGRSFPPFTKVGKEVSRISKKSFRFLRIENTRYCTERRVGPPPTLFFTKVRYQSAGISSSPPSAAMSKLVPRDIFIPPGTFSHAGKARGGGCSLPQQLLLSCYHPIRLATGQDNELPFSFSPSPPPTIHAALSHALTALKNLFPALPPFEREITRQKSQTT